MTDIFAFLFASILRLFRTRRALLLENLALRQQLAALKRRRPRPRLVAFDRLFWVLVRRFWSGWQQALIVVTPETVAAWRRAGFRWYWKLISRVRKPIRRRQTPNQLRELIFRMVTENLTWGAPRIHASNVWLEIPPEETGFQRMRHARSEPPRIRKMHQP
jgi:hypothetical protein